MTPERWRRITGIFHAALLRDSSEHEPFLDEACAGDEPLRAEVEAMLAAHVNAVEAGDIPPVAVSEQMPRLQSGSAVGRYRIEALIGAGGMGQVYRARDPQIERAVAIKMLPAAYAADSERLRRFEQEARASGALNHPNILTLYDVGRSDGCPYLVMELLDGETLRDRIGRGAMPLPRLCEVAAAIARGLAAAHARGIVHRDLKPENVMITRDERVKILDFGIAKLCAPDSELDQRRERTPLRTAADTMLGTVGYMAPEQIRGQPTDERADLFALGAILFEMLTGRRAFDRDSRVETLNAILHDDAPGLDAAAVRALPAIDRIVRRCLEKDPDARFQSARDLAFALESISGVTTTKRDPTMAAARSAPRPLRVAIAAAALAAAVGIGLVIGARALKNAPPALPTFTPLTFRRGVVHNARFSPDGQTIVYGAAWDGNPYEIFTARGDLAESRSLGLPSASVLAISSAGEMAILLTCDLNFDFAFAPCEGTLARVPLVGGSPRPLVEHAGQADWSPDGQRLVVTVHDSSGGYRLESPIGTVLYRTSGDSSGIYYPRFSQTGDRIAFWERGVGAGGRLGIVDLAGHKMVLAAGEFRLPLGLSWSPTGDEIWFSALKPGGGPIGWAVYGITPSGHERVVWQTDGQLQLHDVSRDGRVLVSRLRGSKAIAAVVSEGKERDLSAFQWSGAEDLSADGTTVLFEDTNYGIGRGPFGLNLRRVDGSPAIRLADGRPKALSPDGKWAIGSVNEHKLLIIPTGPGEPRVLPTGSVESYDRVSWLPDQHRIVFSAKDRDHAWRCYVQDLAGGVPRPVTPEGVEATKWKLLVSRDGRYIAAQGPTKKVALYPIDGGSPRPIPGIVVGDDPVQWSADERFLYVRAAGDFPAMVYRLDTTTGNRDLWKAIGPQDPAGVRGVGKVLMTADASTYVYSYWRSLNELFLAEGIK
jgi:Tol biopolymer transport system component